MARTKGLQVKTPVETPDAEKGKINAGKTNSNDRPNPGNKWNAWQNNLVERKFNELNELTPIWAHVSENHPTVRELLHSLNLYNDQEGNFAVDAKRLCSKVYGLRQKLGLRSPPEPTKKAPNTKGRKSGKQTQTPIDSGNDVELLPTQKALALDRLGELLTEGKALWYSLLHDLNQLGGQHRQTLDMTRLNRQVALLRNTTEFRQAVAGKKPKGSSDNERDHDDGNGDQQEPNNEESGKHFEQWQLDLIRSRINVIRNNRKEMEKLRREINGKGSNISLEDLTAKAGCERSRMRKAKHSQEQTSDDAQPSGAEAKKAEAQAQQARLHQSERARQQPADAPLSAPLDVSPPKGSQLNYEGMVALLYKPIPRTTADLKATHKKLCELVTHFKNEFEKSSTAHAVTQGRLQESQLHSTTVTNNAIAQSDKDKEELKLEKDEHEATKAQLGDAMVEINRLRNVVTRLEITSANKTAELEKAWARDEASVAVKKEFCETNDQTARLMQELAVAHHDIEEMRTAPQLVENAEFAQKAAEQKLLIAEKELQINNQELRSSRQKLQSADQQLLETKTVIEIIMLRYRIFESLVYRYSYLLDAEEIKRFQTDPSNFCGLREGYFDNLPYVESGKMTFPPSMRRQFGPILDPFPISPILSSLPRPITIATPRSRQPPPGTSGSRSNPIIVESSDGEITINNEDDRLRVSQRRSPRLKRKTPPESSNDRCFSPAKRRNIIPYTPAFPSTATKAGGNGSNDELSVMSREPLPLRSPGNSKVMGCSHPPCSSRSAIPSITTEVENNGGNSDISLNNSRTSSESDVSLVALVGGQGTLERGETPPRLSASELPSTAANAGSIASNGDGSVSNSQAASVSDANTVAISAAGNDGEQRPDNKRKRDDANDGDDLKTIL